MKESKYYIGFLVNGVCAMAFNDRTEAYLGYKHGLGFVGEVDEEGNVEACWVVSGYMGSYPRYISEERLANRLEVVDPDNWHVKRIKRGIAYDMGL